MRYPSIKNLLIELSQRGPSDVRLEALMMLGSPGIPDEWPGCPRRSRLGLLRQLACDSGKASKARLAALKQVLNEAAPVKANEEIDADIARLIGIDVRNENGREKTR